MSIINSGLLSAIFLLSLLNLRIARGLGFLLPAYCLLFYGGGAGNWTRIQRSTPKESTCLAVSLSASRVRTPPACLFLLPHSGRSAYPGRDFRSSQTKWISKTFERASPALVSPIATDRSDGPAHL